MSDGTIPEAWGANTPLASSTATSGQEIDDLFRTLYFQHVGGVYGLAHRLGGSRLAGEITQEVFLQLWRNPEKFDPARGSLHALLLTMTHHKAVDYIRAESARPNREQRLGSEETPMLDVDDDLLRSESATRVVAALNELSPPIREAIVTAYYGQCTYKEAALVLGQPEGTIKSRIRMGLSQLRTALSESMQSECAFGQLTQSSER
jgi:RNA polymerase sigma-70 factor (ECF subfamily)